METVMGSFPDPDLNSASLPIGDDCMDDLNSANFPIGDDTLRDLNNFTNLRILDPSSSSEIGGIPFEGDAFISDSFDNDNDSSSAGWVRQSYGSSLQLQGMGGVEPEHSLRLENSEPPLSRYGVLSISDVTPIENARARFLQLILDYFFRPRVTEVPDSSESSYNSSNGKDKQKKTKSREAQYGGSAGFYRRAYVANLYVSLVSEVNPRLATLDGIRKEKMNVPLTAADGLYKKLEEKFPKEVFHWLEIVERPNMPIEDAEWFKRLTGRHEAVISEGDYKYCSARRKYRPTPQNTLSTVTGMPAYPNADNSPALGAPPGLRSPYTNDVLNLTSRSPPQHQIQHQPQHQLHCLPHQPQHQQLHQSQHQSLHQSQQSPHLSHPSHGQHCTHTSHLDDMPHAQHTSPVPQHMSRNLQQPPLNVGGRMLVLPMSPPKYCDQCGSPYLRETSKFCSECGAKRIGT